jgi:DNA-binding FrmR family transcriptional regulator
MKEEIIKKLKLVQAKIGKIIRSVERNECTENIIIQINKTQKMLRAVRCLILKDYLIKITRQTGLPEKEILKYHELIN